MGAILFIAAIAALVWYLQKRRNRKLGIASDNTPRCNSCPKGPTLRRDRDGDMGCPICGAKYSTNCR